MDSKSERNKRNVTEFYDLAFNKCKPIEAVEKYTGDDYIQHNPKVISGKAGFINYFLNLAQKYPGKKTHFVRTIAEGDFVVVHCRQEWPGDNDYASMDIFRLDENGKIAEHWDVIQMVPDESVNNNTMF
jgi:predicted SnoaL-like aldol condensation-catalyzing enzyme